MNGVTCNDEQRLYVIPCGKGFTCLGYDVCQTWGKALAGELERPWTVDLYPVGSMRAYNGYQALVEEARKRNAATGWRSKSQLTPQLIGLEGKRVEVVDSSGETRRFWVGKSTGWIPCHLMIARRNCVSECAVYGAPFQSVRVVNARR